MAAKVEKDADTIHRRLRRLREGAGLTVYALAQKAGVDKSFLGRVESRKASVGWASACRLADALDVPVGDLRGDDD